MGDSQQPAASAETRRIMGALFKRLTPFDRKLLLFLTILVLFSFLLLLRQGVGRKVLVEVAGRTVFVADLAQDQQVELTGPLGTTVLRIAAGSVAVLSSPCPQKVCIAMGPISRSGDLLACVPNRLVIRIAGDSSKDERGYDVLSH